MGTGFPEQVQAVPDPRKARAQLEVPQRPSLVVTRQAGGRAHDRAHARLCLALNAGRRCPVGPREWAAEGTLPGHPAPAPALTSKFPECKRPA